MHVWSRALKTHELTQHKFISLYIVQLTCNTVGLLYKNMYVFHFLTVFHSMLSPLNTLSQKVFKILFSPGSIPRIHQKGTNVLTRKYENISMCHCPKVSRHRFRSMMCPSTAAKGPTFSLSPSLYLGSVLRLRLVLHSKCLLLKRNLEGSHV